MSLGRPCLFSAANPHCMKINITKIGVALLAVGICIWSTEMRAQTTTTVTTTRGAFTEYAPGSETMVVRTETSSAPLRYAVTKQTTIVDESGAPVAIERISPGSPLSIQYSGTGDHLVASRIIVQRPATVTAPVTTAPVATQQDTSTTTTRALTHDEKHALKEQREHPKRELKKQIENEKDALDKARDKVEDDGD
jgi:hypothetical protein